jgi:hypothetical protein
MGGSAGNPERSVVNVTPSVPRSLECRLMEIYVVIGSPRSGTSLTAGVLHKCGVRMFPEGRAVNDNAGDEWNPGGHFADADFHELMTRFVKGLEQPTGNWVPDHDTIADIALLVEQRRDFGKWGFKGLHSWVGAKVLASLTHDVRLVRTSRPVDQSKASYKARVGELHQAGAEAFVAEARSAVDAFYDEFTGPKLTVDFDSLLADPLAGVSAITAFAGVFLTTEAIEFVQPELRRFS